MMEPEKRIREDVAGSTAKEFAALAALSPLFREALESMHSGEPQVGSAGTPVAIDDSTRILIDEGMALYSLVVAEQASSTLEVGLGYGFSTVYLLAGLAQIGGGNHTAIDPYQERDWSGIGETTARRLATASPELTPESFTLVTERSFPALGQLIRDGRTFDLTFIDGYHRFDDVLVDFTIAARTCRMGGVIVLHDMWLDSVTAVAMFLRHNRPDFAEIETGCDNLFAVRRIDADRREWSHFANFPLPTN
jgi:predicted O-methyltransferase YrrM